MMTYLDNGRTILFCVLLVAIAVLSPSNYAKAAAPDDATILIIAGPSSHPPGTHEVAAGARLLKYCLEKPANMPPAKVELRYDWPEDAELLANTSSIVFIGDLFPPERMKEPDKIKAQMAKMMNRGCGIVCLHFATGLGKQHVEKDGAHPLLGWMGGYYASGCPHHQSVARVLTATIVPDGGSHPVMRGWKEFTFDDEPYWNNYFGKDGLAANVTSLAYSMLPPNAPKKETVAWAVQRKDGGRGVGIVLPHFYRNWQLDDLRTMVLNSICWSAKLDVPADGVKVQLPDLATFQPGVTVPKP